MKTECVCRRVLSGVRTELGFEKSFVTIARPKPLGKSTSMGEEWGICPSAHKCCFCPSASLPRRRRQCCTSHSFPSLRSLEGAHSARGAGGGP